MDDDYSKYSQDRLQGRQLDTLIGLAKGLVADNKINQAKAEFLQDWLMQNHAVAEHPIISEWYPKVAAFLADGNLMTMRPPSCSRCLNRWSVRIILY